MALACKPFPLNVILGQSVILVGFRPFNGLGSHEREITEFGREITFEYLKMADSKPFHEAKMGYRNQYPIFL